jgi:hypothetical protein
MGRPDPAQRALMLEPEALHRADSLEAAKQRLGEFLEQSPERDNHLGIATVDDEGNAVSVVSASELCVGA